MKKCSGLLLFAIAFLVSFQVLAEDAKDHDAIKSQSGSYLVTEVGTLKFSGITQSWTEQDIANTPGVTSNYSVNDTGTYGALGLGWRFNQYFSVDLSYLKGVKLKTTTHITGVDGTIINVGGTVVNLGKNTTDITLTREGEASAMRLAVNGEYPITSWIGLSGSIEVYQWKATVVNKITVDASGFYVGYNESASGTAPAAAIGFVFKPASGVDVALQYRHMNKVTMPSLTLRYSL